MNTASTFRRVIEQAGLTPPASIPAGQVTRFPGKGKSNGNKAAWAWLSDDGQGGAYGDWSSDLSETWCVQHDHAMTAAERAAHAKRVAELQRIRESEEAEKHAAAATRARAIWDEAQPAPEDHPYLTRKGVLPHSLRLDAEGRLIVPVRIGGSIATLQTIDDAGEKRFLLGGKKGGGGFTLGDLSGASTILICEGYATGASLYEASGLPVVVAFDAGNLKPVALALRVAHPGSTLCLCADDDVATKGNPGLTKGTEAAEAAAGLLIAPDFGDARPERATDFNDLAALRGPDAVRRAVEAGIQRDEPSLISLDDVALPPLPLDAFPEVLGAMIQAVAQATETPVELASMLGLATVATCCQKFFVVEGAPGYTEPLCLWSVVALESGNRKSAVFSAMTAPLLHYEQALKIEGHADRTSKESTRLTMDARIKSLRTQAANSADSADRKRLQDEIIELESGMPPAPTIPRLWAQDVTPEKLAVLMAENEDAMALLSDEGGLFDMMGGRYSNGIPNLDLYLQGHAGASVRVDRKSGPPVDLQRPALTIGISPQPSVLRGLTAQEGFRGRGLLARFLYAFPPSRLGYRTLETAPVPEPVTKAYTVMCQQLLAIQPERDAANRMIRAVLLLTPEAYAEWKDFARSVEGHLRPGGEFEYLKDWAGKLPGAALRIAGVLHCVTHAGGLPQNHKISVATISQALLLLTVLGKHAQAVFDLMGSDPDLEGARRIMRWVNQERKGIFSTRDCFNALKGTYKKVAQLESFFKVLIERGHLVLIATPHEGRGRPPSQRYAVHSDIAKGWR